MHSDGLLLRSRRSVSSATVGGESDREKEQGQSAEKPNAFESEKVKEQQSKVNTTERKSKDRVQRSRMHLKARK
jgi:hypothetical protein